MRHILNGPKPEKDTIFYGTIEKIERDGFRYRYYFNLFNERTNRFDDLVDQMETVNMVPYTLNSPLRQTIPIFSVKDKPFSI